jgi:feruloyl esterase
MTEWHMLHCGGGEGCDTFNRLGTIDQWVTKAKVPKRILADKVVDGTIIRSRPICAYPAVLRYLGTGDIDDATNFACVNSG